MLLRFFIQYFKPEYLNEDFQTYGSKYYFEQLTRSELLGFNFSNLLISILFAIAYPVTRYLLSKKVFKGLSYKYLPNPKKLDNGNLKEYESLQSKWYESCWKVTVYSFLFFLEVLAVYDQKYLYDDHAYWDNCTHIPCQYELHKRGLLLYVAQCGYYLYAIPALIFWETRRRDFTASLAHHIATLILILYSYITNFTRIGLMVMFLHDIQDVFLDLAKLFRYADKKFYMNLFFGVFTFSWIAMRVIIFPWRVIIGNLWIPVFDIAIPLKVNPEPHYSIFMSMLVFLWILHIYWTYAILRILVLAILDGGNTQDDRED